MTMYLTNPGRRRKTAKRAPSRGRKKRRPPKGFRSWKTYMASIRPGAKKKRRKATKRRKTTAKRTTKRRTKRRTTTATATTARGTKMAKRRRKSGTRRKARRRSSRRSSSARGIVGTLKRGVMDGVGVLAGEALVGFVSARVPLPQNGPMGVAVNLGVAAAVASLAGKFAPAGLRPMIAAGAFAAAVRDSATAMGVAIPGLSSYPGLSAYPRASLQGFGPSTEIEGSEPGLNALPISAGKFNSRTGIPAFAPFGVDDVGQMAGMVQQYD